MHKLLTVIVVSLAVYAFFTWTLCRSASIVDKDYLHINDNEEMNNNK